MSGHKTRGKHSPSLICFLHFRRFIIQEHFFLGVVLKIESDRGTGLNAVTVLVTIFYHIVIVSS